MSNPTNDQVEERVREEGYEQGYEDCMKEWLGFLRFQLNSLEMTDNKMSAIEFAKELIKSRWHVDLDVKKDVVDSE